MVTRQRRYPAVFRVLDALDHPHGGRILRLRLQEGEAPPVKELKGSRMVALSPDEDEERALEITGFAVFGGKPSDERLRRTGRVDVHVVEEDGEGANRPIGLKWTVAGPIS